MEAQSQEFPLQEINIVCKIDTRDPQQVIQQLAKIIGPQVQNILSNIKNYRQTTGSYQKYNFPTIKLQKQKTKSTVCAKVLTKGTKAFKCHQCMFQSNSIICVECFENSDHKGHIFQLIEVFGGCCDCGDQEKWDVKGSCFNHNNSDILKQIKVNAQNQLIFSKLYQFSIFYLFHLFQKVRLQQNDDKKIALIKEIDCYGQSLFENLYNFNVQSLISNLMTVELLCQKLDQVYPELNWLKQLNLSKNQAEMNLIQIVFQILDLSKTGDIIINLFTSLFPIKQFKKSLTIIFWKDYNKNADFAMGPYNHLSCQLLTSHQLISDLVLQQQIQPLHFQVSQTTSKSFQDIAQNFVRFYVDIEYLSKLHKDSSQKYLTYHIMKGNISNLAGYRHFANKYDQSINYFGIQLIYLTKVLKIIQKVRHKDNVLIKGIRDLFQFIIQSDEVKNFKPMVYISQERTLSLFMFTLFQNNKQFTFQKNIQKLIDILGLNEANALQVLDKIIKLLNYNIQQSALVMGHPQSYDRFYTYYCFTFKKNMMSLSLDFYLYKILTYILKRLNLIRSGQVGNFIRTLLNIENMFQGQDFLEDDQSIFDRRKSMLSVNYYMNVIIQLSQTNLHQLIIGMKVCPQNFQKQAITFYLNLIKLYNKISVKDLKSIIDTLFQSNQIFEKFISTNQNIIIEAGKVSIREDCLLIVEGININYLKCFKAQFINIQQTFSAKKKSSSNNFAQLIFDKKYIQKAIDVAVAYRDIIIMKGGKIRQKQCGVLCQFIKELLKLQYCLQQVQDISEIFLNLFKSLSNDKKSLQLFDAELIRQISQAEQYSKKIHQNMKQQQKQKEQDRKKRLLAKKSRKIAKFRQTHEKISLNYRQQLKVLQIETIQEQNENYNGCMICHQNKLINNDLMLMGYMQNSDLYYQFLKDKQQKNKNYNMVFKTCGHQIHMSCHTKINQGRQYSICQLCKSTVNALFPLRIDSQVNQLQNSIELQKDIKKDICQNISNRLSIINVVIAQSCQNGFGVQFEDKRCIQQQLIESFVNQFIFSGLLNQSFFIKKQLPVYSNILKSLKIQLKGKQMQFQVLQKKTQKKEVQISQSSQMCDQKEQEKNKIVQHLQIYLRSKVNSYLFDQQEIKEQLDLNQSIIKKINYLFKAILLNKNVPPLDSIQQVQKAGQVKTMRQKIFFFEFPQNIQILSELIGKCPNCFNFTNMVMICVLCSWQGCRGCKKQSAIDHTHKKHNGNSVFIQGDNGCIFYVSRKKYWLYKSIYEDYLGQPYLGYSTGIKLFKYVKNNKRQKQIYQDIIQHQIQQKIRYEENTKKKAFTVPI